MHSLEEICCKALILWGEEAQKNMVIEECAELILVLRKLDRNSPNAEDNVCEEIADVELMLQQMRLIFDPEKIEKYKQQKLERLVQRFKKYEKVKNE